jgi:hypothetical protein
VCHFGKEEVPISFLQSQWREVNQEKSSVLFWGFSDLSSPALGLSECRSQATFGRSLEGYLFWVKILAQKKRLYKNFHEDTSSQIAGSIPTLSFIIRAISPQLLLPRVLILF